MKRLLILSVVGALALTACGGEKNTDPRKGRVVTAKSDCLFGSCYSDWKACAGPDLIVHIEYKDHVVKNSPECKP